MRNQMKICKVKEFVNGWVAAVELNGKLIELTDTFLPGYTKDPGKIMGGGKTNATLKCDSNVNFSRRDRWFVGVSTMSGCPVGCKFCACTGMARWTPLTADEIVSQVEYVIEKNAILPEDAYEFKVNYTRMGEPFLNIEAVKEAIETLDRKYRGIHHFVSTVGIKGSDFSWVKRNVTLQFSVHSLDEARRSELIPIKTMSLEEIGRVRVESGNKITLNFALLDWEDFSVERLREYFDPEYFFIKLSPINPNGVSRENGIQEGVIPQMNAI